jgi:hypothetical protein
MQVEGQVEGPKVLTQAKGKRGHGFRSEPMNRM